MHDHLNQMAQPKGSYQEKKGLTFIYRNKNVAIWAKGYRGDIFAVFKGEGEGLVTIQKKSSEHSEKLNDESYLNENILYKVKH